MSLKITVTLITAGLVVQLWAIKYPVLGFSYTSEKNDQHDKLSMSATKGIFVSNMMCNVSAWTFFPGNGSSTITINAFFRNPHVNYYVDASIGDNNISGMLLANLTTKYDLSLTANENYRQCKLEAKFSSLRIGIHLKVFGIGKKSAVFNTPAISDELQSVLSETLTPALPALLTDFARNLTKALDRDGLCGKILAGKPESFPEPNIFNNASYAV